MSSSSETGLERPDARWLRAHAALTDAALILASECALDEIPLAAIAAKAGVSRSTAYLHAPSARALVEEVLEAELEEIQRRELVEIAPRHAGDAIWASTMAVVAHIERHHAIYVRGLADEAGPGSLHGLLATQFSSSVRLLLRTHDLVPAVHNATNAERLAVDELVIHGIANSTVGQLAAWVALPAPRDPMLFLRVNASLLPSWWPRYPDL